MRSKGIFDQGNYIKKVNLYQHKRILSDLFLIFNYSKKCAYLLVIKMITYQYYGETLAKNKPVL